MLGGSRVCKFMGVKNVPVDSCHHAWPNTQGLRCHSWMAHCGRSARPCTGDEIEVVKFAYLWMIWRRASWERRSRSFMMRLSDSVETLLRAFWLNIRLSMPFFGNRRNKCVSHSRRSVGGRFGGFRTMWVNLDMYTFVGVYIYIYILYMYTYIVYLKNT